MQMRALLAATIAVLLAGCAEGIPGNDGGIPPSQVPSTSEAAGLLAQASGAIPDRYGVTMTVTRDAVSLADIDMLMDEPAQTAYFRIRFDPTFLASQADEGEMGMTGFDPAALQDISVYDSPQGSAFLVNGTVLLSPPGENNEWMGGDDGLSALTDPESLLDALGENVNITNVTPTTLRGRPAIKVEGTQTDEDGTHPFTVWLFTEPTRVARIEMPVPADEDEPELAGATMSMDMLYDDEVTLAVPDDITRALSLRFTSDRAAFSFGGDEQGAETWTFEASGSIPLDEVQAEIGDMADAVPTWTMKLSDTTKTQDGLTLTYADKDADGKISAGDTLTIARTDDATGTQVSLRDLETGYRIVPGAGLWLLSAAIAGAALVARRR